MASIVFLGVYWFIGGIFSLFAGFVLEPDRGWRILIGIISIIAGLAILAYPYYRFLILPVVFIIFIGSWALVVGGVRSTRVLPGKTGVQQYWYYQHNLWVPSARFTLRCCSSYPLYLLADLQWLVALRPSPYPW